MSGSQGASYGESGFARGPALWGSGETTEEPARSMTLGRAVVKENSNLKPRSAPGNSGILAEGHTGGCPHMGCGGYFFVDSSSAAFLK
jgi:hypothetical protein